MRLQQILGHLQRHQALIVRRLRRQQLDAGKFRQRLLEAAQTLGTREDAAHALEDDDAAGAVHLLEQRPRGRQADAVVVHADERDDLSLLDAIRDVDDGNFRGVELQHARAHRLEVHGCEQHRVRTPGDDVLDLAHLIRNAVGPRRHVLRHARVHLLRGVVRAHAKHGEVRIRLILGKDRNLFAVGIQTRRCDHTYDDERRDRRDHREDKFSLSSLRSLR